MGRPKGSKNKADVAESAPVETAVAPTQAIVQPTIRFEGDKKKHALQILFEGEEAEMPVIRSVGVVGIPKTNTFVSFVMHSQGHKILKIEAEEPNLKAIAEESAKIEFVNSFMGE